MTLAWLSCVMARPSCASLSRRSCRVTPSLRVCDWNAKHAATAFPCFSDAMQARLAHIRQLQKRIKGRRRQKGGMLKVRRFLSCWVLELVHWLEAKHFEGLLRFAVSLASADGCYCG